MEGGGGGGETGLVGGGDGQGLWFVVAGMFGLWVSDQREALSVCGTCGWRVVGGCGEDVREHVEKHVAMMRMSEEPW